MHKYYSPSQKKMHQASTSQKNWGKDFPRLENNGNYPGAFCIYCRCAKSLKLLGLKLHKEMIHMVAGYELTIFAQIASKFNLMIPLFQNFPEGGHAPRKQHAYVCWMHVLYTFLVTWIKAPLTHEKPCYAPSGLDFYWFSLSYALVFSF